MKNKLLSTGYLAVIMLLIIACKQKTEEASVTLDTLQIKTEIQAIENHFADVGYCRRVSKRIMFWNIFRHHACNRRNWGSMVFPRSCIDEN